jgi:hypothetical protein
VCERDGEEEKKDKGKHAVQSFSVSTPQYI